MIRYGTILFLSAFRSLRIVLLLLCLAGIGASVWFIRNTHYAPINMNPVCNREVFVKRERGGDIPTAVFGNWFSDRVNRYTREANGTGFCAIYSDTRWVRKYGSDWHLVFEGPLPSDMVPLVSSIAPYQHDMKTVASYGLGFLSFGVLFFIWLPSTLIALFARKVAITTKEIITE